MRRNYEQSEGEPARIRNSKILPEVGSRLIVAQTLLFERFENLGPWDLAGARASAEADWAAFNLQAECSAEEISFSDPSEVAEDIAALTDRVQRMNTANAVPHSDEVVYEGSTGRFLSASMSDLKHVSQDRLQEHDHSMTALGLRCIGDFVADADQQQQITRCYGGHGAAIALHGHRHEDNLFGWSEVSDGAFLLDFSEGHSEFHTHFEDGTLLVTVSIDAALSKPNVGIYCRSYEGVGVSQLWERHLDGISRFQTHRDTLPVDHTQFAEAEPFLALMDEFCRRMLSEA